MSMNSPFASSVAGASSVPGTGSSRMSMSPSTPGGGPGEAATATTPSINVHNGGNGTVELEWNPSQVCADLQKASQILADRQLKLSAKWAVEQWMGLPADVVVEHSNSSCSAGTSASCDDAADAAATAPAAPSTIPDDWLFDRDSKNPAVCYAKVLMELGEYQHAAATLSQPSLGKYAKVQTFKDESQMPPPLCDLSPFGLYLRAYALYLAGERRKEEEYLELKSEAQKYAPSVNPFLHQLSNELLDCFEKEQLDPFGLHVYGMVLKQALLTKAVLPPRSPSPQAVLMKSILDFPYNWSAWLDLADCALEDSHVEREIEQQLQPYMAGHFMYHFFCAHLQTEHQAHPEALQLYERWLDPSLFGGSPYLLTQYAVIQYHLREFVSSKRLMEDLHEHMPYRLDSMDIYSNILYVQEDSVALSHLAHTAVQVDKYRPETCVIVGNYYSLKQQRAKAIQYFERALKIDRSFTSAWTLIGHEYVEFKQTANAIEAYRRAVQVSPGDYRAWYGLGQTYEFLNMHLYALYYYKRACQLRPYDARMWCALGTTFTSLHRISDATRAYERALQQGDTEGVATQKLAALYKQDNQIEKAAQCYLQHLEVRYRVTSANPVAAFGQNAVNLETLLQGLAVEATEAEAILYLAHYHKDCGEYETAITLCSRLLEYAGPEKEEAKALLRELRSRTSKRQQHRVIHTRSKGPPPSGW